MSAIFSWFFFVADLCSNIFVCVFAERALVQTFVFKLPTAVVPGRTYYDAQGRQKKSA
jgi:hypothetical protein